MTLNEAKERINRAYDVYARQYGPGSEAWKQINAEAVEVLLAIDEAVVSAACGRAVSAVHYVEGDHAATPGSQRL